MYYFLNSGHFESLQRAALSLAITGAIGNGHALIDNVTHEKQLTRTKTNGQQVEHGVIEPIKPTFAWQFSISCDTRVSIRQLVSWPTHDT